jgi:hypothetical protein
VGAQVEGVSRRARVGGGLSAPIGHFGRWFQQQRELRGISIWFVAARVKLPPERIRAIEMDAGVLKPDGHGRGIARALASAIGADPEEGVARMGRHPLGEAAGQRTRWVRSFLRLGGTLGVALALSLGAWLLGTWLQSGEAPPETDSPQLVYRPDYVGRLLGGDGS